MTSVVLDKSVVKCAPRGFLRRHVGEFDFLLTSNLLLEIVTEGVYEHSQEGDAEQQKKLYQMINANLEKVNQEVGNAWLLADMAIQHEITTATSSRTLKRVPLECPRAEDIPVVAGTGPLGLYEDVASVVMSARGERSVIEMPLPLKAIRSVSRNDRRGFFERLAPEFLQRDRIVSECTESWQKFAQEHRFRLHPDFSARPGFLCYGISLMQKASWYWAHWLRDDGPIDTKKPANAFYDVVGVGHMAIADGLMAKDEDMLHIAWACWPEKRDNIYTYNQKDEEIAPFKPEWER